jgi:hypothetical protein
LIKEFEPSIVYLRKTDANFAINNHSMAFKGQTIGVKGFLGVKDPGSETLCGGCTFMFNGHRNEVVFEISRTHGGTHISIVTSGPLSGDEYRLAAKNFINSTRDKILARMVERDLNPNPSGGGGQHPRLEGRRRTSGRGPQNYFSQSNFSQNFIVMANDMAIHYR